MTPRDRRLAVDREEMAHLAEQSSLKFSASGRPPDRYRLQFEAAGLELGEGEEPQIRPSHEVEVFLPLDYPRRPPLIAWQTPIFHPNILGPDRHGAVCLGSWAPAESLADLCQRLINLASYRQFSTSDALNVNAARWAEEHHIEPGVDLHALLMPA